MTGAEGIEDHITAVGPQPAVAEAFRRLSADNLPGFQRQILPNRFDQPELRLLRAGHWLAAAVLHPGWVQVYLRRPVFREGGLQAASVLAQWPDARSAGGEVKLRLTDPARAGEVLDLLGRCAVPADPFDEAVDE